MREEELEPRLARFSRNVAALPGLPESEEIMRIAHRRKVTRTALATATTVLVLGVTAGSVWANRAQQDVGPAGPAVSTNESLLPKMLRASDIPTLPGVDNDWRVERQAEGPVNDRGSDYLCQSSTKYGQVQEARLSFVSSRGSSFDRTARATQLVLRFPTEQDAAKQQRRIDRQLADCKESNGRQGEVEIADGLMLRDFESNHGKGKFATSSFLVIRSGTRVTVFSQTYPRDGNTNYFERQEAMEKLLASARRRLG